MTLYHNIDFDTIESRLWGEHERQHSGATTVSSHEYKANETTPDVPIGAMLVGDRGGSFIARVPRDRCRAMENQCEEWGR